MDDGNDLIDDGMPHTAENEGERANLCFGPDEEFMGDD